MAELEKMLAMQAEMAQQFMSHEIPEATHLVEVPPAAEGKKAGKPKKKG
jgi:hypothetical protein